MNSFRDPTDEWLKATIGAEANPMVTLLGKLTDIQYKFCVQYVACGSPAKAAKSVGLSSTQNPALLIHLPKVAACINILTAKREAELGRKTAGEIVERLRNTPLVEEDDFSFSTPAVEEREEQIKDPAILGGMSEDDLLSTLTPGADPSTLLMQLPRVRVSPAQNFGPQWIIERFVTIAERCMQIEPVFDRKGRPIGEFQFNAAGSIKALEMLGRTMAMFKDKVEVAHELSGFKEDQLDARIAALVHEHPALAKVVKTVEKKEEVAA